MPDELLSVSAAADLIGVHPVTIRRWTDDGRLPVVRTSGGHRRIPLAAVEAMGAARVHDTGALPHVGTQADQTWAEHALVHARHEIRTDTGARWKAGLSASEREANRESGHRLMGLLLQHVAGTGDEAARVREIRRLSAHYGEQMRTRGLPMSEALRATLFFRDALTESTAYYPPRSDGEAPDQIGLMRKVNAFMNEVQIAIAEAYEQSA